MSGWQTMREARRLLSRLLSWSAWWRRHWRGPRPRPRSRLRWTQPTRSTRTYRKARTRLHPGPGQGRLQIYGIALVTTDGKVYTAGDVKSEVSIQSISKVFTMAKVIEEQGPEAIAKTIGVDATGMRFNSIVSIEFSQKALGGPEMNSLVNPGAIATTSMVKGATRDEVWKSILGYYSDFAGRPLSVNQEVFKSEADTNQRNQAIGYLMYAYGYIKTEPMRATDVYTEQCSVSVNAKDLALMAGTLANAGKNP